MKKIVPVLLIVLFVISGCSIKGEDNTQSAQVLKELSAEYKTHWKKDYNYDTPILIDTLTKWEDFLSSHPPYDVTPDELNQKYDASFFKHNVIYAYVKSEDSGSNKLRVSNVEFEKGNLKLYMKHTKGMTDDMAAGVCLFGINRSKIQNVKSVQGIISK